MTSQPTCPESLHTDSWGCGPGIPAFPSLPLAPEQCGVSGSAHRPRASASHARAAAAAASTNGFHLANVRRTARTMYYSIQSLSP